MLLRLSLGECRVTGQSPGNAAARSQARCIERMSDMAKKKIETSVSLKSVIEVLETVFDKFNEHYFENKLSKPVITVSPDTTKGAYGWCTTWRAWKDGKTDGYYEINMCAEHLNRGFPETCGTLLHEMIHLFNLHNSVKDCSRGGTYHNKRFLTAAEEHGLIVEKHAKYGYAITKLNPEAESFVSAFNENAFELHRDKSGKKPAAKKSSTRKYVCPMCGSIIRATKEVHVTCTDCDIEFELEA